MRTPTALLAALLLVACSGDKSDDSSPAGPGTAPATATGAGTGVGTGTGTGTGGPGEDCTDGVDNDNDGLLDCEDSDCAADAACFESACDDGVDNDGDGRMDCVDEDCWGNGCQVTIATLTGADSLQVHSRNFYSSGIGGPSCNTYTYGLEAEVNLINPTGTVRVMPATTPTWTTCTWAATSSGVVLTSSSALYYGIPLPVHRGGFTVDSGCPIQTSGFLPAVWAGEYGSPVFNFRTRPNGAGPVWFGLNIYGGYSSTGYSTSTVVPGSPCSTRVSASIYTQQFPGVILGSDYSLANP